MYTFVERFAIYCLSGADGPLLLLLCLCVLLLLTLFLVLCREVSTLLGLVGGMCAQKGTGAYIPGLSYLVVFAPLLLCLNWLSYIAFLACVPAMILCAFKAPHLTRHAKALAFTAINVANLLPVGKGVAWNHWPTLI